MNYSKIVEITEWSVTTAAGDELTFRIEVLAALKAQRREFWARLYRLELLRFGIPLNSGSARNEMEAADYRAWVCDDNFGLESVRSSSATLMRGAVIARLSKQLGVPLSRGKVRASKKRAGRKR
jgi:hypothetical protein